MNINRFCYLLLLAAAAASAAVPYPFAAWLLAVSLLTFLLYGVDKRAAQKQNRRIPEATLLLFGIAGGWPGAIFGQQLFRHKTQKQPFRTYFYISILLNVAGLVALWRWVFFAG
ncbi:DUF1294 domain-containing protein [Dryocola clanedunensis]